MRNDPAVSGGPSIGIIGGGPAGLSAARLLKERGVRNVTVLEAADRVGGKSLSVPYRGARLEMGTCYSTLDHATTNRWMRQLGIRQYALGRQMMDGVPFRRFIGQGPGQSLMAEGYRYIGLWRKFWAAHRANPLDPRVLEEASMPLSAWLGQHGFVRLPRFMLRGITAIGYGYIDEISVYQALKWVTPTLIFSGLLNQLKMPEDGWQYFWEQIAEGLDVRRGNPVVGVTRSSSGIEIETPISKLVFDQILVTIPIDEFAAITAPSAAEREIVAAVEWGNYTATMCLVDNWFTDYETESFETSLMPGAPLGRVLSARRERKVRLGRGDAPVYLCAQYGPGMSAADLAEHLVRDIEARGASVRGILFQKLWKYHPRLKADAIRDGVTERMKAMQGEAGTWYAGATFSHEAVSAVVAHNLGIVNQMARRLGVR